MSKQKAPHISIFKLHSSQLADSDWNLTFPIDEAGTEVVELNDSQLIRFIDDMNGINTDEEVKELKGEIQRLKKDKSNTLKVRRLYKELYATQFHADYVCIIMDSMKHYDRCNEGFTINGIRYRRFLGTNNGIKRSTIIYINVDKYDRLFEIMECDRDKTKPFIPAKLEAYRALICSGSIPVSMPRGIIVVPDCETSFTSDGIYIDDSESDEPKMTYIEKRDVTVNASDGFGFMCPALSRRWSGELNNKPDDYLPAVNTRGLPWTKGMLFTFDFHAFADEVAQNYMVKDVWGDWRDVRDAEVILTASMLKLWDSYKSWEDYYSAVLKYGYQFAVSKTAPYELEEERTTNYQFLQSYELTDTEIEQLVEPTLSNIRDAMGCDYRKSILYLGGKNIQPESVLWSDAGIAEALMIEPKLLNDPYVRSSIYENIKIRIKRAKTGVLDVHGNFAIMGGDPYSLAQSMFGLKVTGLLKAGEIYHKFWSDRGVKEVACFRAPMTSHNNIRKQRIACDSEKQKWYRYITTCVLLNSWDTMAEALNGLKINPVFRVGFTVTC